MSKTFRPWTIDQPLLLPPSVQDFVGEDHLARFILALVLEPLDLGEIEAAYASERGQPPFDPAMMTALLLYGYCNGVYSSRRIAKAARERVDFLSIVGLDPPDFRTVSDFRKRHLKALSGLFGQVLKLCEQAGLVKLGHVALDGTKIKANASKHKAMSYERMEKRAAELEAEVERWLSAAEAADAEEDRAFGRDKSGEELPKWVADKKKRVEKIRAAKAELEAEAKAAAAAKAKAQAEERRQAEGRKKPGRPAAPPSEEPDPKAQKNFTDPESRIMKTKDGFIQGYNAQAAVDATAQVIVAHGLDAKQSDQHQLAPMADAIEANLGKKPTQLSADAGYCSDANLTAMEEREIASPIQEPPAGDSAHAHADQRCERVPGGHEQRRIVGAGRSVDQRADPSRGRPGHCAGQRRVKRRARTQRDNEPREDRSGQRRDRDRAVQSVRAHEAGHPLALRHEQHFRDDAGGEQDEGRKQPQRERSRFGVRTGEPERQQKRRQSEGERVHDLQPEAHRVGAGGEVRPRAEQQEVKRNADRKADHKRDRDPPVEADRFGNGIGGQRGDELGRPHVTDLRQAAPSDFSARWSATLTATSDILRRAAVAAIDWPSREIEVTMSRWRG